MQPIWDLHIHHVLYHSIERCYFFARSQYKVVVIHVTQWHTIVNYFTCTHVCDTSQGGNFIKVGLSIDDPNFPCSQGIKRGEVRYSTCMALTLLSKITSYIIIRTTCRFSLDQVGFLSHMLEIHQEHWSHLLWMWVDDSRALYIAIESVPFHF